jgi:hypothetical protein
MLNTYANPNLTYKPTFENESDLKSTLINLLNFSTYGPHGSLEQVHCTAGEADLT